VRGQCRLTFHFYSAGISVTHHKQFVTSSTTPFVCMVCNQTLQKDRVSQLVAEVDYLNPELAVMKELLAKAKGRQPGDTYPMATISDSA